MSTTVVLYKELRVLVEPTHTDFYVRIVAEGPAAASIAGWHTKRFPTELTIQSLFEQWASGAEDPTSWPFGVPP